MSSRVAKFGIVGLVFVCLGLGYWIGYISIDVEPIVSGVVESANMLTIVAGDNYLLDNDKDLRWYFDGFPSLEGASVEFQVMGFKKLGRVVDADTVEVELTAAETILLQRGPNTRYQLRATLESGSIMTIVQGDLLVVSEP